jgi:hypothetical protein
MHFNHFNFDFSAVKVLWALTFAALLVLMVVLLGRDRVRRYPFFTASIVLLALRLLMSRLLYGKLPSFTLGEIFLTLADLTALVGLLVLVELARQAFDGLQRSLWVVNSAGLLAVAGTVIVLWGPWPTWKTLTADSHTAVLRFMQLFAEKTDTLVLMMTIGLGLAVILFGRKYKAGWRSHTQRIVIGLSIAAISQLALIIALDRIARTAAPQTRADLDRIVSFRDKLINTSTGVYLAVLVWWIVCLWMDEPGGAAEPDELQAEEEQ